MPEFVIGLRSKDGDIQMIRVKAKAVGLVGEPQSRVWKVVGELPDTEILINPDAFVFGGPKEMITDLG